MKAIITEKPSVAADIARVLGVKDKRSGYYEGTDYLITWGYGHLVGLALPDDYGWTKFRVNDLPILPDPFRLHVRRIKNSKGLKPDRNALKQLDIIRTVFNRCQSIIVATDAGREGELIFRWIYQYLACDKPFERLWISSLTDQAIRDGLENLKPGSAYDNLYLAAEARSRADWLIGINASRALCLTSGEGNNSLGRVQTPTLAMICERYRHYTYFIAEKFWQLCLHCHKDEHRFMIRSQKDFQKETEAENAYEKLKKEKTGVVKTVTHQDETLNPPLLHDLTSLQQEANKRFGLTADQTLQIAQKLYEKKYITYPRTGSRYIPSELFDEIPRLFTFLATTSDFGLYAGALARKPLFKKAVNGKKVTDHHALLVTGVEPKNLSPNENKVYNLIAGRMLEAFSEPHIRKITTVEIQVGTLLLSARQIKVKKNGWKDLLCAEVTEKEESQNLPYIRIGEEVGIESYNIVKKKTRPSPLFTEGTLLAAMEGAGKEIENKAARSALRGIGIGTPATRAGIIETLLQREYIERSGKKLLPTRKGLSLYHSVKNMQIANVELTGQWESALKIIEEDPGYFDTFMQTMIIHVRQITDEMTSICLSQVEIPEPTHVCPRCKLGKVVFYAKIAKCNNSVCNLIIYRRQGEYFLSDAAVSRLIRKGRTPLEPESTEDAGIVLQPSFVFDKHFHVLCESPGTGPEENR